MGSWKGRWLLAAVMVQLTVLPLIRPAWGRPQRSLQEAAAPSAEPQEMSGVSAGTELDAKLQRANELYLYNLKKRSQAIAKLGNPSNFSVQDLKAVFFNPVYPCPLEARIGVWGDGGKWVCMEHRRSKAWVNGAGTAVSIGCRGETSFEKGSFTRLGMAPHTLDFSLAPQMQATMKQKKFMKFYNLGLSGSKDLPEYKKLFPTAKFVTIDQLVQLTGSNFIDVFKIDCEECEHGVVADMRRLYTRETVPFGQIQMEFHFIFEYHGTRLAQDRIDKALLLLRSLEALGFRVFHAEVNMLYPDHYEIALIHEKLTHPPAGTPLLPATLAAALNSSAPSSLQLSRQECALNSKLKWPGVARTMLAQYLLEYMVPEYPCGVEARFGNWGVGGKWLCGLHKLMGRAPVLISISNNEEFSFENDVMRRLQGTLHVLAPPAKKASNLGKAAASLLKFFAGQLSGVMVGNDATDPLTSSTEFSLSSTVDRVNVGGYVDILNIDCRGCEGQVVDEIAATYDRRSVPFGQVLITIHGEPSFTSALKVLRTLNSLGFANFHVELYESFNPQNTRQVFYWAELAFIHESII